MHTCVFIELFMKFHDHSSIKSFTIDADGANADASANSYIHLDTFYDTKNLLTWSLMKICLKREREMEMSEVSAS